MRGPRTQTSWPSPTTRYASAARRAASRIQPLSTRAELDARIAEFADGLLGPDIWKPDDLYRKAAAQANSASGFYNYNIKLAAQAGPVIVRIPIPETDVMDLAIWPESSVLRTIRDSVTHAPRLLYATEHPRFQVLEFIQGELLDTSAPRGMPVPGHVIGDVAEVLSQLCAIPREKIPPLPEDWPADGKTADFARRLSAVTARRLRTFPAGLSASFSPRSGSRPTRWHSSGHAGRRCTRGRSGYSTPTSTART